MKVELEKYKEAFELLQRLVNEAGEVTIEPSDVSSVEHFMTVIKKFLRVESEKTEA